ncbi:TonB-dependent receptor [Agrobacterium tumefaciens]|uniref:TonB-dependent receptor n=1 Tax=Agrobacterium tumefaciens TaxID=358 RepID=UPI00097820D0|nr:TonB-dependent receptor [Agrobacterium tumefaciens]NSZ71591.1 TonB-dependent receptor [Agrobacterium tumefaciens]OMP70048.1 TonB-dependent siderophore receptor [Agrobacterium tumefaciens]
MGLIARAKARDETGRNGPLCGRRHLTALLVTSGVLGGVSVMLPTVAKAQQQITGQSVSFNIPSQPLSSAINAFIRASGWEVGFASQAVAGKQSSSVKGSMTPAQALQVMLTGTGVGARISGPSTAALVTAPVTGSVITTDGSTVLQTITVTGEGIDSWEAPPSYAGGQVASGAKLGMLGNTSIMDAPFNVASYTSKTIQDQQAVTIADVVANDPSVRVYTSGMGSSAGVGDSFYIRGFSVGTYSVLIDGYGGIAPDRIIPVETMESVEILKGPNALLNGYSQYGSLGGSINVVPKRATDEPVTRVTTSYASDSQFGTHLDFGRRFGENEEWGVRVNGIFRGGNTAIDGQSAQLGVGTIALDYRGDDFRASLDAGYVDQQTDVPTGAAGFGFSSDIRNPAATDLSKQIYQDWEYSNTRSTYVLGKFEYDLNPSWTIYGGAGYRGYSQESLSTDIFVNDALGNATATAYYSPIHGHSASAQTGIRGEFDTGPISHKVNLNGSYLFQALNQQSNYYGFAAFDTNIYNAPTVARPSTAGFSDSPPRYWNVNAPAVTLADTISFLDDHVLLTAGVRYQEIGVDVFNPDGSTSQAYDRHALTPAFGLVVKPVDNLSIYANYIEGLQQGPTAWAGTSNAGQIFPPILTQQFEAGVKYDFGTFTATASVFQIAKPGSSITTDAFGNSVFTVNGEQRNRGVELNVFGEATENLRLLGGIAYTQGTLTKTDDGFYDGNTAIGVPRWQSNLGIEWDPQFAEGLTLSGRIISTSSQFIDQANTQKLSGWTRFDIGAQYKTKSFGNPLVLRASVENVFDKNYWAGVDGGWATTGTPRTFKLSATVDF